jgi:hypothetical protein
VVAAQLRAALPDARLILDPNYVAARPTLASELRLDSQRRSLRSDQPQSAAAAILATFQPLEPDERVVLQWVLSPVGPIARVKAAPKKSPARIGLPRWASETFTATDRDADDIRAERTKASQPLFLAVARLGVAAEPARSRMLLRRLTAAFHVVNAPGAHLARRPVPNRLVGRRMATHAIPIVAYAATLNSVELTSVLGFPIGTPQLPGLVLGGCRQLAPAADIPRVGRVLARATFPGAEHALALTPTEALRHLHVLGPTGVGKSVLLTNCIVQDMKAGFSVVVIDPKGDLITDVLDRVPSERIDDVVVLDPTDDRPVGLNPLTAVEGQSSELVVENIVGLFRNLYRAYWGPRTDDVMRAALLTLVSTPHMTLCEVPLLLSDPGFRRRLVGRLDDPIGLEPFWGWFEGLSDGERLSAVGPLLNKLRAFLLRRRIRDVIGQAEPRFDLDRAIAERKIVLAPLSKGLLGDDASALIGSLLVARLWEAVQRRAGLPQTERPPVYAYIDEAQDFLALPTDIGDVLAQARGLGLGLTLAHQHLGQLPTDLRLAVLANARSRVLFQAAAADARLLAREYTPYLEATDLQGLGPREVVVTVSVGARVAPPVTGVTFPPSDPAGFGQAALQHSRERYGVARADIDAALRARHDGGTHDSAIGRRLS